MNVEKLEVLEIVYTTGTSVGKTEYLPDYQGNGRADPCENCSSNPKNNILASGVCLCSLPALNAIT